MHGPSLQLNSPPSRPSRAALVDAYRATSPFFFSSQEHSLLAQTEHVYDYVCLPSDGQLASGVRDSLLELARINGGATRAALALPFELGEPARGWLLNSVEAARGRVQPSQERERAALEAHAGYGVGFQPTPRKYVEAVTRALRSIEAQELDKVVLARRLELAFDEPIDCSEWLRRFYAQNPAAYVFSIDLAAPGEPLHKLMGASPELLLQKRGGQVATNPLAGSRARGRDKQEDEARVRELLASDKDRREHALVVDAVASTLRAFCTDLQLPKQPSLLSTPTMWHLSTSITGKLRDVDCSSIELVQALHPTPAVAGLPRERALSLIAELEGGARGPFAGAVGHCDAQGDGEWAVSLRCAELRPQSAVLFAGAGIVAGSDPWSELDETGAKFRTALRALGVPLLSGAS